MGPPSRSWVQTNPVIDSAHFRCAVGTSNKGDGRNSKWVKRNQRNFASQGQVKPVVGLDPSCDTLVGLPHLLNPDSTGPIRFEVGESSSLSDSRPLTHEAHELVMAASSKTGHDISGEGSISCVEPFFSADIHEKAGESPKASPMGFEMLTQVDGGLGWSSEVQV